MSKLYRLHGQAGSRIWKPLWCMRELGIVEQAERSDVPIKIGRTVEIFPGEDDKREYYVNNVNPNGRMPALEDLEKGLTLFDSAAINIYLCKKHESELAPKDAAEDALCTQWAVWGAFEAEQDIVLLMIAQMMKDEARKKARTTELWDKLERPMNALNISLGKSGEYLLGDRFTVADLNAESVLDWGLRVPGYEDHIKSNYPLVHAWMTKIRARPHHHANQNA